MSAATPTPTTADASQKAGETCPAPEGTKPLPESDQREVSKSGKHDGAGDSSSPGASASSTGVEKIGGAQNPKMAAKPKCTMMKRHPIQNFAKVKTTWECLLEQIRREEELKGSVKSLSVTLSVCSSLVCKNG